MSRTERAAIGALLAVVALLAVGVLAVQPAAGQPTVIDDCTTISEPGAYVLGEDVEGTCIRIESSDVVFDGGGHTISGVQDEESLEAFAEASSPAPSDPDATDVESYPSPSDPEWNDTGVAVTDEEELSNVTVTNLRTTDLSFGVYVDGVNDGTVWGVEAEDGGNGVEIRDSNDVAVGDAALAGNARGAFVWNTTESTFWNVTATDSTVTGLALVASADNVVAESEVAGSGSLGIALVGSNGNAIHDTEVSGSGAAGVAAFDAEGTHLEDVVVQGTTGESTLPSIQPAGIALNGADDTTIEDATTAGNANWAFASFDDSEATLADDVEVDGRTVSFQATDVAMNSRESAPADADQGRLVGNGLIVTNTSASSWINVLVQWAEEPEAPTRPPAPEPIEVPRAKQTPTPTSTPPTPAPTSTPTETATPTSTPTGTPVPNETVVPTPPATDTPTATPTETATATVTPNETATPTPNATATPDVTETDTDTLVLTQTATPTPDDDATVTETDATTPTASPIEIIAPAVGVVR